VQINGSFFSLLSFIEEFKALKSCDLWKVGVFLCAGALMMILGIKMSPEVMWQTVEFSVQSVKTSVSNT